jgi:uncharacterized protein (DUF1501 family)
MISRRRFFDYTFRSFSAAAGATVLGKLGAMNAYAAGNSNYKALVCVFLYGGNDCHNTLIPMTTPQQNYQQYASIRGSLALPQAQLPQIAGSGGAVYGLHPSLAGVQQLYQQGKAAFVANVGSLVVPITRQQYLNKSVPVPDSLFSHSNQTNQWQTARPDDFGVTGWGGRAADILQAINAPSQFPMIVATGSGGLYPVGAQTWPTIANPSGGTLGLNNTSLTARHSAFQQLLTFDNGVQLMQASNQITQRGANDGSLLKTALNSAPALQTVFPYGELGNQLKHVAKIMSVRGSLGMNRQIFFVGLGGFDTHSAQLYNHGILLQDVGQSLAAFYQATLEMGIADSVTSFTNSEFGRTLQPSSGQGTDHAWGGHQMVVEGAVQSGIYGTFPSLALGGPDDANNRGTLIPTTSVEQYGATLAKWFGVPAANLPTVFTTLGNFGGQDLGFLV